jgi:hypothetical protein
MAIFMTSMSHCLTSCLSIIILVAIAARSLFLFSRLAIDPGRSPDSFSAELALELELEQHTRLLKERESRMSRCCGGSETLGWQGGRIYKHLLQRPWGLPFRSLDTRGGIKNFACLPSFLAGQTKASNMKEGEREEAVAC